MMKPRDGQQEDPALPASPYVNHFEVAHNPFEFLIEFGHYRPSREENDGKLVLHTCLAISPPYAKMLSDLLVSAVQQFEKCNGLIASVPEMPTPFDIVLHSLPEFEERARKLRAHNRADGAGVLGGDAQPLAGKGR